MAVDLTQTKRRRALKKMQGSLLFWGKMLYMLMARYGMQPWDCVGTGELAGNSSSVLYANPAIQCDPASGPWLGMVLTGIFIFNLFAFGFPVLCWFIVHGLQRRGELNTDDAMVRYGTVYLSFDAHNRYWAVGPINGKRLALQTFALGLAKEPVGAAVATMTIHTLYGLSVGYRRPHVNVLAAETERAHANAARKYLTQEQAQAFGHCKTLPLLSRAAMNDWQGQLILYEVEVEAFNDARSSYDEQMLLLQTLPQQLADARNEREATRLSLHNTLAQQIASTKQQREGGRIELHSRLTQELIVAQEEREALSKVKHEKLTQQLAVAKKEFDVEKSKKLHTRRSLLNEAQGLPQIEIDLGIRISELSVEKPVPSSEKKCYKELAQLKVPIPIPADEIKLHDTLKQLTLRPPSFPYLREAPSIRSSSRTLDRKDDRSTTQ